MDAIGASMDILCMPLTLPAFSTLVTDARYCHVRPLRHTSPGVLVACAGAERCLPEYRVARDGFACFGVEFVAQGEGSVTLDGRTQPLRPGNAFLYGPGIPHEITTHPQHRLRKYFVNFFGREADAVLQRLRFRPGEARWLEDTTVAQTLFDELIREGQRGTKRGAEAADAYLRILLQKIADVPTDAAPNRAAAYLSWRRCQDIVEADFRQLRGLHELSERTGYHPSHLCRLYKQFGSHSPHADITRRKMNHAAMLLTNSPTLIKTVALQVGYEDPLHFSRVFRKHFGRSPQQFQRSESRAG